MTPIPARQDVVRDTYFGTTIEDPYRWMEDWQSDEAHAWLTAQAAHTRAVLDALPHRAAVLQRIVALDDASPRLSGFRVAGDRTFYLRLDPGQNLPKLVVRTAPDAPETVLVDPNTIAGVVHTTIDWYVPSRDGQRV